MDNFSSMYWMFIQEITQALGGDPVLMLLLRFLAWSVVVLAICWIYEKH